VTGRHGERAARYHAISYRSAKPNARKTQQYLARPEILRPICAIPERIVWIDDIANPGLTQLTIENIGAVAGTLHPQINRLSGAVDACHKIFGRTPIAIAGIAHALKC